MRITTFLLALSMCLGGCAAPDAPHHESDPADESELRGTTLLSTRAVASKADPTLLAAVRRIEASGGKGGWFESVLPFDGAKREVYYLLRTVPPAADEQAPMLLLRLEHSRAALEQAIGAGTPVVIGMIPLRFQAAAAAFSGLPIATDALAAGGISGRRQGVVFLPPDTLKTTFAHELQHWKDFEDAAFQTRFDELAKPFLDAAYLSSTAKDDLGQIVIELRGHGMGERQALEDLANDHPNFLRGGVPVSPVERKGTYESDAANQVNVFLSVYGPSLRAIANKVKVERPADHERLVRLIATFNLAREGSRLFGLLQGS